MTTIHPRIVAGLRAQLRARDPAPARATYSGDGPLHADAEVVIEIGPGGEVAGLGTGLEPGDRILAGSIVQVPLAPGERVAAEIERLGRVDAVIAD